MPTPPRRFGFSRKAQYGWLLGYVIAVAGMMVAVLLLVVAIVDPQGFAALRGAVGRRDRAGQRRRARASPASSATSAMASPIISAPVRRMPSLQARTRPGAARARSTAQAREGRESRGCAPCSVSPARSRTRSRSPASSRPASTAPRRLATLSAGASAGVRVGMPVRAPDGLIGRVLETGRWASRVLMITDGASNVPVRSLRDGTPAHGGRPRRRHDRTENPRSRRESVPARRRAGHLGRRRHLPARRPRRAGDRGSKARTRSPCPSPIRRTAIASSSSRSISRRRPVGSRTRPARRPQRR